MNDDPLDPAWDERPAWSNVVHLAQPAAQTIEDALAEYAEDARDEHLHGGYTTGIPTFHRIMGRPIGRGWLVVIAARPGVGKTQTLLGIATANQPKRGLLINLEMTPADTAERWLAHLTNNQTDHWRRIAANQTNPRAWARAILAEHPELHRLALHNHATHAAHVADLIDQHHPDYVLIDYLGLLDGDGDRAYERVSSIVVALKRAAKETRTPIFVACQLRRRTDGSSEDDQYRRPNASDLRESGRIEEEADLVIGLWRDKQNPDDFAYATLMKVRHGRGIGTDVQLVRNAAGALREVTT